MTLSSRDIEYINGEVAFTGVFPIPVNTTGALTKLSKGVFNLIDHTWKLAVFVDEHYSVGQTDCFDHTCCGYEIKHWEANNPLYPEGGVVLTGVAATTDFDTGVTTFAWDPVTFESAPGTHYFDDPIWTPSWPKSVMGAIYDTEAVDPDHAFGNPVLFIFALHPHNHLHFLSDGEKHTVSGLQVRL